MASELIFQYGQNLTLTDTINDIDFTEEEMENFGDINSMIDDFCQRIIDKYNTADTTGLGSQYLNTYISTKPDFALRINHFKSALKSHLNSLNIAVMGCFRYFIDIGLTTNGRLDTSITLYAYYYDSYSAYNTNKVNFNNTRDRVIDNRGTIKYPCINCSTSFVGTVKTLTCTATYFTDTSTFTFNDGSTFQSNSDWTRGVFNDNYTSGQSSIVQAGVCSQIGTTYHDRFNPSGTENSTSGKYPSGEMGGLGTFDDSTDLSDISSKPTLNLSDLGFFSVWNPSTQQLRTLADYVWNDPANIAQWPQIFRDGIIKPMDYIISLALYPFDSSLYTKINTTFAMGGIPFDGGITALEMTLTMDKITEQFIDVDMGTVDLKEYFGSFLDYAPYSQISLYLPYYGVVQLSMNEVQNADSIKILYRVNILDGSTAIKVHIDRQTSASQNGSVPLKHVLYEYFTNLKTEIPLTSGASAEQMKMLATVMSATITAAAPIAGAGASHIAGAVEGAATLGGLQGAAVGAGIGNQAVGQAVEKGLTAGAQMGNRIINSLPSGGAITRGNIGGMNTGLLSERRPFLIITRPIQVLPENYKEEMGYCTSIRTTLTNLQSGFVQCESVDSSGLDATASEKDEIVSLLQQGVYI